MLNVYYDLRYFPVTFDFIPFMANATAVAKRMNLQGINLTVIAKGFRKSSPRDKLISDEYKHWRLLNIIESSVGLMPLVRQYHLTYEELDSIRIPAFPIGYPPRPKDGPHLRYSYLPIFLKTLRDHTELASDIRFLSAPGYAHHLVSSQFKESRKVVSITLRYSNFQPERNSQLTHWNSLYHLLEDAGYRVIVIPDFEDIFDKREAWKYQWQLAPEFAINQHLRQAIYERCTLNLAVNNGTSALLSHSNSPFLIFKLLTPGIHTTTKEYFKKAIDLTEGENPFHFLPTQSYVWEGDDISELKPHVMNRLMKTN